MNKLPQCITISTDNFKKELKRFQYTTDEKLAMISLRKEKSSPKNTYFIDSICNLCDLLVQITQWYQEGFVYFSKIYFKKNILEIAFWYLLSKACATESKHSNIQKYKNSDIGKSEQ